ncbi:MAG: AMP-binding protein [Verrucomicrobiales bacterium]|nr:AMP-binding protein [Verrucomicrobiales bacterium]
MDATELISGKYWASEEVDIRLNPAVSFDTGELRKSILERGISSSVVLATSGSSGRPRWVVLSKDALLVSAKHVNEWCGITEEDIWLGGLSTFHVGGLGIYCRAYLSRSKVLPFPWNRWTRDGSTFLEAVRGATLTSLTPVHLHDLVTAKVKCPASLRGVFIGGGALSTGLAGKATELGWPLWTTYGMTEACSQIATSLEGSTDFLPVLPHWETVVSDNGELQIKGASLMSGYFDEHGQWLTGIGEDGFYTTGDLVELQNSQLRPIGRADDLVKILGELVSPLKLENALSQIVDQRVVILVIPEPRRGAVLRAVFEGEIPKAVEEWNQNLPPFEKIDSFHCTTDFPRTEVGKIDRIALAESLGFL